VRKGPQWCDLGRVAARVAGKIHCAAAEKRLRNEALGEVIFVEAGHAPASASINEAPYGVDCGSLVKSECVDTTIKLRAQKAYLPLSL
jgi:hypothetical protein